MIHTKEPTNCFYVYLSAYRSTNDLSTNLKAHAKMAEWLGNQQYARDGVELESSDCVGYYREEGLDWPVRERSVRLKVANWAVVEHIASIAHLDFEQEAVLVINSQTHTAQFINMSIQGLYVRCACSEVVGTFQRMPKDANIEHQQGWTQDEHRLFWWIVPNEKPMGMAALHAKAFNDAVAEGYSPVNIVHSLDAVVWNAGVRAKG